MKRSLFLSLIILTASGTVVQAQTSFRPASAATRNSVMEQRYTPTRAASYQEDDFVLDASVLDLASPNDAADETSRRVSEQLRSYQSQSNHQMQPSQQLAPPQLSHQPMAAQSEAYPSARGRYCSECGHPTVSCGCGGHDMGSQNRGNYGGNYNHHVAPNHHRHGVQNDPLIQGGYGASAGCDTAGCDTAGCDTAGCDTAGCDTGGCDTAGCDTGGYFDGGGYDQDYYGSGRGRRVGGRIGGGIGARGCMSTVVGGGLLSLRRDGADFRTLSYEQAMPDNRMLVGDADISSQNGVEVFFARQSETGTGWEARYWGLEQSDGTAMLGNMPQSSLLGLNTVTIAPWGTIGGLFNSATRHDLSRTTELHNVEFNVLNYATSCGPRSFVFRRIAGLRIIRFNDALNYSAFSSTNFGASFSDVNYNINTANTFVGAQIGGQGEYCITDRLRLALGSKVGVGGNSLDVNQRIQTSSGAYGIQSLGADFNYMNSDTDLAMFGEMEAKTYYHITDSFRVSVGYRLFGLSGIALAEDQIPYDYTDPVDINAIKRDGSAIFQGLTFGTEYSF